ncbi:MAG: hypothetical protein N2D54_13350 [Chloroflexota bacterium]
MKKPLFMLLLIITFWLVGGGQNHIASAQAQIIFRGSHIENNFPDGIIFNINAESTGEDITSAKLFYYFRNDKSITRQVLELTHGDKVNLSYRFETEKISIPPSTPIFYYWEVVDEDGNRELSEEFMVFYDDIRYDWKIREDTDLAVWWHDRPDEFGETVFDISQRSFAQQHELFQAELDFQIRIIINNTFDEFASWHSYVDDFVGGQAYSLYGLTIQIVPDTSSQER